MCCNMQQSEQGYHVCIDVLVRHRGGGLLYGGRGVRERERERKWSPLQTITAQTQLSAALQLPIHRAGKQTTGEGNICMGA